MKATEQYFHVVLFIMLYRVVLTLKTSDETLVSDHPMKAIEHLVLSNSPICLGYFTNVLVS